VEKLLFIDNLVASNNQQKIRFRSNS